MRKVRMVTFIIGGARSGKSRLALELAAKLPGKRAYLATACALDREMEERIANHRRERSAEWVTLEEPLAIPALLGKIAAEHQVLLLDCLTLWLSNLLLAEKELDAEITSFLAAISAVEGSLFIVSNEVGQGIVPENALARRFRDLAGRLNQAVAAAAQEVYLVVAGIPLKIK